MNYLKILIHPWVGPHYETSKRLLVLGESNYCDIEEIDYQNLVINCVHDYLNCNEDQNFSRFATKISKLVDPGDSLACKDYKELWNYIIFYNYVQVVIGTKSRQRPTKDMWKESFPAFQELLFNT